ncbi:MFS transporter [Kitasatospora sp. NPDC101157]|uniref:MFS transporter n=1 Tax=Kitasatospora sp. NPDC101157 TaxID=3364098 RepID=UPI003803B1AF
MTRYKDVFRAPEFLPLFLVATTQVAAQTVAGLAFGTLVFERTHSPLASALATFGPSLAQAVGATTVLASADRLPPRAATTVTALLLGAETALPAVPRLPIPILFLALFILGITASLSGGVRYGLLNEILTADQYLAGRSLFNISFGITQIVGFALGGLLVTLLTPEGALLFGAGLYTASAVIARLFLSPRPARAHGTPSMGDSWRNNAALLSPRDRRSVFLALWVPNGLIVGCESLYIPYAPHHAALLFSLGAAGMLTGDVLAGRLLPPLWRGRLAGPFRLLLALPYLGFALSPPLPVAAVLVLLASIGYCAGLLLQEQLLRLIPQDLSGQALGLHSSGTLAMQGVGAALAGTLAQVVSVTAAIATMAVLSVAVTLYLGPALRTAPQPTG